MENNDQHLQFKTNINCGGCVATVTPYLDRLDGIAHWKVDTDDKDKILTVAATGASAQQVIEAVQQAGFAIEAIDR